MKSLLVALGIMASVSYAETNTPPASPLPPTIPEMINRAAADYSVSPGFMQKILMCESSLRPDAVGDGGTSFGIAQIHLPAHPEVTKDEALDPEFSIRFLASEIQKNRAWEWSCYAKMKLST